jgi:hypothetical protein
MVIVNLTGGLGNQMFQFAFGTFVASQNNCDLKIDVSSFENYEWHSYSLDHLNIIEKFASNEELKRFKNPKFNLLQKLFRFRSDEFQIINEKNFSFNPIFLNSKPPCYISGYWQSEKYFKTIEPSIRSFYQVKTIPSNSNKILIQKINSVNSVALHIRRGNYVSVDFVNELHGTSPLEYYNQAVKIIESKVFDPVFFVFSDDIVWAKKNLKLDHETIFVDINSSETDYEDLRLMYTCKNNIIANSTFSWWGAWLNPTPDKIVIAPKEWFKDIDMNNQTQDLIPDSWIRI